MTQIATLTIGLNAGPLSAALDAVTAHAAIVAQAVEQLRDTPSDGAKALADNLQKTTETLLEAVAASVVVSDAALPMGQAKMAACFNEWMRRFIDEPARFAREFESVSAFLADEADGKTPTYGETSAAYMAELAATQ